MPVEIEVWEAMGKLHVENSTLITYLIEIAIKFSIYFCTILFITLQHVLLAQVVFIPELSFKD